MKAIIIREPGGPEVLQIVDVPTPEPEGQEVRVRVRAFGLNRADLSQRRGHYPAPFGDPQDIPGLEFSGEVEKLGNRCLGEFPVGSRVCGIVGGGAYAEQLCIHERLLMPIPDMLSYPEAASIPEAFLTAHDALVFQAEVQCGENVLVHAAGSGVGTAAVQLAHFFGCRVFATSRSREKLEAVRPYGSDVSILLGVENLEKIIEKETKGQKIDVVLDFLGGSHLQENIQVLALRGRLILIGLLAGSESSINLSAVLRNRLTLRGTALRTRALEEKIALTQHFLKNILPHFQSQRLRPVLSQTFPLHEIQSAHVLMEENKTFGKLVGVIP